MFSKKNLFTLLLIIAILVLGIFGYSVVKQWRKKSQASNVMKAGAITVQTAKVTRHNLDEVLTFNGDIQALQTVDLKPKISGRLLALSCEGQALEEGMPVVKNQLIGKIDDRELKAQEAKAKAAIASAEAQRLIAAENVSSAQAGITSAEASKAQKTASYNSMVAAVESAKEALAEKLRERDRQAKLVANQATTQQDYDKSVTAYRVGQAAVRLAEASAEASKAEIIAADAILTQAKSNLAKYKANVQEAEAAILQAKADLEEIQVDLSETEIRSPMDGVIGKKYTDPGSMVSPSTTIVTIVSVEQVKIVISVPVTHLARLKPNETSATVRLASLPGKRLPCTVYRIYPTVETVTRTAQVEIRLKNFKDQFTGYQLKPGMYATVDVLIEKRSAVLAVDAALPIRNLERFLVYKVYRNVPAPKNSQKPRDIVKAISVKQGVRFKSKVEILQGLKEGDEIVVVGQHRLTDGATIKVIPGNNLKL